MISPQCSIEIPIDIFSIAFNWFVNRTPLVTRLPRVEISEPQFILTNDDYKMNRGVVRDHGVSSYSTLISVSNIQLFPVGSVIQIDEEYCLVSEVNEMGGVLALQRGFAGTKRDVHDGNSVVYLISDTQPTGKISKPVPKSVMQHCQTFKQTYRYGTFPEHNHYMTWSIPEDRDRMMAMQDVMDWFEIHCYYGKGSPPLSPGGPATMKGLQTLIQTNNVDKPTNYDAYKPSDFLRDTIHACWGKDGDTSMILASKDFFHGFAVWGYAAQRINIGMNVFGTPIDAFEVPFLHNITIIPAPLLNKGTVICLSAPDVRVRIRRKILNKPSGTSGGVFDGDILLEGAIDLDNESRHAFVSGVTAFAAA